MVGQCRRSSGRSAHERLRSASAVVAAVALAFTGLALGTSPATAAPLPPTITVGAVPIAATMSPDGSHVYVTNLADNTVSVIDTATNTVSATIALTAGSQPKGSAITSDGGTLYVANSGLDSVSAINTATHTVTDIALPPGSAPSVIMLSPDGVKAYVVDVNTDSVSVITTATNLVAANIGLTAGDSPQALAFSPNGASMLVSLNLSNRMAVIDTATSAVTGHIDLLPATGPVGVVALTTAGGDTAYVANVSDVVSVINLATNTVTATIPLPAGSQPAQVTASPDGATVFVANQNTNTVSVIDTATNTITSTIPGGTNPTWVAVTPDGATAYFTNYGSSDVSVAQLAVLRAATVPAGAIGASYSFTLPATNVSSFAVTSGALPAGLSLNPATGVISGTPTAAGSATFAVTGTGVYTQRTRTYTVAVDALLAATGSTVTPAVPLGAFGAIILGLLLIRMRSRFGRRRAGAL